MNPIGRKECMRALAEQLPVIADGARLHQKRALLAKLLVAVSVTLLTLDMIYRNLAGITYQTKDSCVLYTTFPRWMAMAYEYFIELMLIVVVGIFAATLLEKYFPRINRLVPKNPVSAFLCASIIPVCSCSAIPLIRPMEGRIPFRAIITFIVAAPLLNPYIIMVSVTVLGLEYALLRIACSFILAVSTGFVVEFFYNRMKVRHIKFPSLCSSAGACSKSADRDIFSRTFQIFKKLLPFLILAGFLSLAMEIFSPGSWLKGIDLSGSVAGNILVILIGIPIYFCNGADVLFLRPLMLHGGLPLGTAVAFSMTSTSVCISSLILLTPRDMANTAS